MINIDHIHEMRKIFTRRGYFHEMRIISTEHGYFQKMWIISTERGYFHEMQIISTECGYFHKMGDKVIKKSYEKSILNGIMAIKRHCHG